MKAIILLFFSSLFLFTACGDRKIDYSELLEGSWKLDSVAALQIHYINAPFLLRGAKMNFNDNGVLSTTLMRRDSSDKVYKPHDQSVEAEWELSADDKYLKVTASFEENYAIRFVPGNDRVFYLKNNSREFKFIKI